MRFLTYCKQGKYCAYFSVDRGIRDALHCKSMAHMENITIRPTADDRKLINLLCKKMGVSVSQIVRIGLRVLAAKEGVSTDTPRSANPTL